MGCYSSYFTNKPLGWKHVDIHYSEWGWLDHLCPVCYPRITEALAQLGDNPNLAVVAGTVKRIKEQRWLENHPEGEGHDGEYTSRLRREARLSATATRGQAECGQSE